MTDQTYLYRFYDADATLLYVGITSGLVDRFEAHMKGKEWWRDVRNIVIERHETRADALHAERHAIQSEGPVYNVQHGTAPPAKSISYSGRGRDLASAAYLHYCLNAWNASNAAGGEIFGVTRQAFAKWIRYGMPVARSAEAAALADATERVCATSPTRIAVLLHRPMTNDGQTLMSMMRQAGDPWVSARLIRTLLVDAA
jgi:hypothetical protein